MADTPDTAALCAIPRRIQRQRTKGWKMPAGAVYVGRPTGYGNPFTIGCHAKIGTGENGSWLYVIAYDPEPGYTTLTTATECVEWFRRLWSLAHYKSRLEKLRGKDLACWCRLDQPCHADILLELANGP